MSKQPSHNANSKLKGEITPQISFKVRCKLGRFPTFNKIIAKVRKASDKAIIKAGYDPQNFKGHLVKIGVSQDKQYLIAEYAGCENTGR